MREYERQQLLERVDRESATVGATIPERITVTADGTETELALREFVYGVKQLGDGEATDEEVATVKKRLRRARLRRRQRIEEESLTYETGTDIAEEIVGIDRALNALDAVDSDPATEAQARETADQKRWLSFLRRALGREQTDTRGPTGRGGE